eukprot:g2099.t1
MNILIAPNPSYITGTSAEAVAHEGAVKTGVLMLNMGGPSSPEETEDFLRRLFQDSDIIELGGGRFQEYLGNFISKRRTPKVQKQYEVIGGSPIRKWTEYQGEELCRILDETRPESAPHKAYTAFRYANPLTEEALKAMESDGVEHAIAFSQFPQWSCTTSGSSMNELWREVRRLNLTKAFKWSVIDRWPIHEGFVQSVTERIEERMLDFEEKDRDKVVILFSAHSVPMKVVERGDQYVPEVAATVKAVMERITERREDANSDAESPASPNKYILGWQSKVGYVPWMVPSTESIVKNLGKRGTRHVLVVPIAFTSDHIETLFEIGHEYAELAEEVGIKEFRYTEGLNDSASFCDALADIVSSHLDAKKNCSPQYKMKCVTCIKPLCRKILNPAFPQDTELDETHQERVDEETRLRLQRDAKRCWDMFYKENSTNFYKDRHYLHKVFKGIISNRDESCGSKKKALSLLEIGCGVGNSFFPLMKLDPELSVYAVDLSSEAVRLIKENPAYESGRCSVFVCDVTKESLPRPILDATVDNVLLLFVLSAMRPEDMLTAVRRAAAPLRIGGKFFFRDFARGDEAQLRFDKGHKLGENFYARGDGTRAYYFTLREIRKLFDLAGFDVVELEYVKKTVANGKTGKEWIRTWVHGVFRRRGGTKKVATAKTTTSARR